MTPKVPQSCLEKLRASKQPPPWRCKLHLRRNRTLYGALINERGDITRIGERLIYSPSDIGFGTGAIEDVTIY